MMNPSLEALQSTNGRSSHGQAIPLTHIQRYSIIIKSFLSGVGADVLRAMLTEEADRAECTLQDMMFQHQANIIYLLQQKVRHQIELVYPPDNTVPDLKKWNCRLLCLVLKASDCLDARTLDDVNFIERMYQKHFQDDIHRAKHLLPGPKQEPKPKREWIRTCGAIQRLVENLNDTRLLSSVRNFICRVEMGTKTVDARRETYVSLTKMISELAASHADRINGEEAALRKHLMELTKIKQQYDAVSKPSFSKSRSSKNLSRSMIIDGKETRPLSARDKDMQNKSIRPRSATAKSLKAKKLHEQIVPAKFGSFESVKPKNSPTNNRRPFSNTSLGREPLRSINLVTQRPGQSQKNRTDKSVTESEKNSPKKDLPKSEGDISSTEKNNNEPKESHYKNAIYEKGMADKTTNKHTTTLSKANDRKNAVSMPSQIRNARMNDDQQNGKESKRPRSFDRSPIKHDIERNMNHEHVEERLKSSVENRKGDTAKIYTQSLQLQPESKDNNNQKGADKLQMSPRTVKHDQEQSIIEKQNAAWMIISQPTYSSLVAYTSKFRRPQIKKKEPSNTKAPHDDTNMTVKETEDKIEPEVKEDEIPHITKEPEKPEELIDVKPKSRFGRFKAMLINALSTKKAENKNDAANNDICKSMVSVPLIEDTSVVDKLPGHSNVTENDSESSHYDGKTLENGKADYSGYTTATPTGDPKSKDKETMNNRITVTLDSGGTHIKNKQDGQKAKHNETKSTSSIGNQNEIQNKHKEAAIASMGTKIVRKETETMTTKNIPNSKSDGLQTKGKLVKSFENQTKHETITGQSKGELHKKQQFESDSAVAFKGNQHQNNQTEQVNKKDDVRSSDAQDEIKQTESDKILQQKVRAPNRVMYKSKTIKTSNKQKEINSRIYDTQYSDKQLKSMDIQNEPNTLPKDIKRINDEQEIVCKQNETMHPQKDLRTDIRSDLTEMQDETTVKSEDLCPTVNLTSVNKQKEITMNSKVAHHKPNAISISKQNEPVLQLKYTQNETTVVSKGEQEHFEDLTIQSTVNKTSKGEPQKNGKTTSYIDKDIQGKTSSERSIKLLRGMLQKVIPVGKQEPVHSKPKTNEAEDTGTSTSEGKESTSHNKSKNFNENNDHSNNTMLDSLDTDKNNVKRSHVQFSTQEPEIFHDVGETKNVVKEQKKRRQSMPAVTFHYHENTLLSDKLNDSEIFVSKSGSLQETKSKKQFDSAKRRASLAATSANAFPGSIPSKSLKKTHNKGVNHNNVTLNENDFTVPVVDVEKDDLINEDKIGIRSKTTANISKKSVQNSNNSDSNASALKQDRVTFEDEANETNKIGLQFTNKPFSATHPGAMKTNVHEVKPNQTETIKADTVEFKMKEQTTQKATRRKSIAVSSLTSTSENQSHSQFSSSMSNTEPTTGGFQENNTEKEKKATKEESMKRRRTSIAVVSMKENKVTEKRPKFVRSSSETQFNLKALKEAKMKTQNESSKPKKKSGMNEAMTALEREKSGMNETPLLSGTSFYEDEENDGNGAKTADKNEVFEEADERKRSSNDASDVTSKETRMNGEKIHSNGMNESFSEEDPKAEMKRLANDVIVHYQVHKAAREFMEKDKMFVDEFFTFLHKHKATKEFLKTEQYSPFKTMKLPNGLKAALSFLHAFTFRHVNVFERDQCNYVVEKILKRMECEDAKTARQVEDKIISEITAEVKSRRRTPFQNTSNVTMDTLDNLRQRKVDSKDNIKKLAEDPTRKNIEDSGNKRPVSALKKLHSIEICKCWKCRQKDVAMTIAVNWRNHDICELLQSYGVHFKIDHLLPAVKANDMDNVKEIVKYLKKRFEWEPDHEDAKIALILARFHDMHDIVAYLEKEGVQDERVVQCTCFA